MIPGSFEYHRPRSLAEAVALLADLGEEARPLGGGHSLIPMMKLRLATPDHLDQRQLAALRAPQDALFVSRGHRHGAERPGRVPGLPP